MSKKQKKIGLLGGMSTVATAEYYKLINEMVREKLGGFTSAEMIILSVNFGDIEKFVRNDQWDLAGDYLAEKALEIQNSGADCLFLGTNTMHKVRDKIISVINIPFIDIFQATAKAIRKEGIYKVGILGTYPVMSESFYRRAFKDFGIELIAPEEEDKVIIDKIIFDEFTKNVFTPESKVKFIEVMKKLQHKGAEGIVLGCTEIKLLVNQDDVPEIPLFDTTTLHCRLAARICVGEVGL